jgi:hypothetical protein
METLSTNIRNNDNPNDHDESGGNEGDDLDIVFFVNSSL